MRETRVVALPVHVIEVADGVLLKRGTTELLLSGAGSADLITSILLRARAPRGISIEELLAPYGDGARAAVAALLDDLRARRILVEWAGERREETPFDVLAWDAGSDPENVRAALSSVSVHVLGVNPIAHRLVESFAAVGGVVRWVDEPAFRSYRASGDATNPSAHPAAVPPEPFEAWSASLGAADVTCLVVCSDFGGLPSLSSWNEAAWKNGWSFLSVVLQDLTGYVGPLVVPGETACFECFLARRNASAVPSAHARAAEMHAFHGQAVTAYHPSMTSVLGNLAALELTKFYARLWRSDVVNRVIEYNPLGATMASRRLLKVPRCPVCSPMNEVEPVEFLKDALAADDGRR